MNLAQQMTDYVARPRQQTYGVNDPPRIAHGPAFNHPLPSVEVPPCFTSRIASHGDDPGGERLAAGIARTIEFTRSALTALRVTDDDGAIATAAAHAWTSCFSFGLRHYVARGRDDAAEEARELEEVIERGVSGLRANRRLGAGGVRTWRLLPAFRRLLRCRPVRGARHARRDASRRRCRPWQEPRPGAGRGARSRTRMIETRADSASRMGGPTSPRELRAVAVKLGASEAEAEAIAGPWRVALRRGLRACTLHLSNRGGSGAVEYGEIRGDGMRRAVSGVASRRSPLYRRHARRSIAR